MAFFSVLPVCASAPVRVAGDIFESKPLHLVSLGIVFLLLEFFQILIVDTIRVRHIFLVPSVITSLVAAQEKNRSAAGVEMYKTRYGRP